MCKFLRVVLVVAVLSAAAWAQKAEVAVTVGAYHPVNNAYSSGNALVIEGNVAGRIASVPFLSLYVEVPVAGTFKSSRQSSVTSLIAGATPTVTETSYSAIFVAPGLRLKLAPSLPVSPYVAVGGGLAHFNRSFPQASGSTSSSINKGVIDLGGGLDFKIAPFLSLRAEVRDFYSGSPELTLGTFNQRQHNIVGTAGLVLRF